LFAGLQTFCTGGKFTFKFFCIADMTVNLWGWVYDYFGKGYYASGVKKILRVQKKGNIEFFGVVVGMIQMWTIYQLLLDILKSQDTKITLLDLG
jgi:hypothetical protein